MTRAVALAEIIFGLLVVAVAVALLIDATRLPPPRFDVLGSAAVPRTLCLLIIAMTVPVILRAAMWLYRGEIPEPDPAQAETMPPRRPDLAILTFVLVCGFVAILQNGLLNYGLATALFLILLGGLLAGGRAKTMVVATIVALIIGFGGDYLFTSIFLIALP